VVAFNQPFYQADENGGSVAITVSRLGGVAGMGTVDYTISPLSATPGVDYVPASGQLTFLPGQYSATFHVTLLDDSVGDGNKTIKLALSNPTNMGLGVPNQVTNTIVDNESFNEPAGSLDTGFSKTASANGPVYTIVQHPDGKLTVAGDFTEFANVTRRRLARLLTNGLLDTSFDPGIGANDTIRTLALQHDGKLLVGGFFTNYLSTNRNGIARLHIDGTLDASFNPGAGADNPVYSLVIQPNEKILVGGSFNRFSGQTRPRIVRLNTNGVVDASFNTGAGPNSTVFAVALQSDGKVLVGGDFTSVNGSTPTARWIRPSISARDTLTAPCAPSWSSPTARLLSEVHSRPWRACLATTWRGSIATAHSTPISWRAFREPTMPSTPWACRWTEK
jgi:uncharacterized delta-60 repeat protein